MASASGATTDALGLRRDSTLGYAVTLIGVGIAVAATLGAGAAMKHTPTLFFCAVMLSSWVGGIGPGIFAGLLSALALD